MNYYRNTFIERRRRRGRVVDERTKRRTGRCGKRRIFSTPRSHTIALDDHTYILILRTYNIEKYEILYIIVIITETRLL